jgi:transposase InsO family protein
MKMRTALIRGVGRLGRMPDLSKKALARLKWMDYYQAHDHNARLTCRHFDISPQTFYRWWRRYDPDDLRSLEDRPRRPWRVRQPTATLELVQAVQRAREAYPRWGKDKLVVIVRREGFTASTSMVGRILRRLKDRGVLREAPLHAVSVRKRLPPRPYAIRKPKEYTATVPGDIVQVDTLDIRPLPGTVIKHLTARDVVSRWDVLEAHSRATSFTAARFLDAIEARMPFAVKAIQVDGGSEFQAQFEMECQRRSIRLFVLPPRSPKLNGHVERAQRTHTEEFYEVTDCSFELADLTTALREWERVYNTVRPHQSLGYLTPKEYLQCHHPTLRKEVMCH